MTLFFMDNPPFCKKPEWVKPGILFAPETLCLFSLCRSQPAANPAAELGLYSLQYVLHAVECECGFDFTLLNILER